MKVPFKKLLRTPRRQTALIDRLPIRLSPRASYSAARRGVQFMPSVVHSPTQYENNRGELPWISGRQTTRTAYYQTKCGRFNRRGGSTISIALAHVNNLFRIGPP